MRMVQPCTVFTVLELRRALGLTQVAFAHRIGVHKNSVINWERGYAYPSVSWRIRMQVVARYAGLTRLHSGPLPIRRYDPHKREYYEGKPGPPWRAWSGQKRGAFLATRAKYRKLDADIAAGRVHAQPVVECIDDASDADCM